MKILTLFFAAVLASLLCQCPAKKANAKSKSFSRSFIYEVKNIFNGILSEKKCKTVKQKNGTPSAANGDSPIKSFGYPNFSINSKSTKLEARAPLSYLHGYRQPIRVGAYDYLIAGSPSELKAFFDCFSDYEVVGEFLNEDGKWEKEKGTIKIQLSNLRQSPKLTDSLWEMMFTMGIEKITEFLDPKKIVNSLESVLFGTPKALSSIDKIKTAWRYAQKYLPIPENLVEKVAEISAKDIPLKKKISEFILLLKNEQKQVSAFKEKWSGEGNVGTKSKILVSLTMYTKPEHNVRATYDTGKPKINVKEIGDAVNKFLKKVA